MMDNLAYLLAAYLMIWIALFVYMFGLSQKQKRILQELEELKLREEESASKGD